MFAEKIKIWARKRSGGVGATRTKRTVLVRPWAYPGPATRNRSRQANGRIFRQHCRYACHIFVDRPLRVSVRYFRQTSETRRHISSGYGVALSNLACSAALTSCAETFQQCHAALFPQDLPALVSRCNWACLHTCFGCSACSPCLVACVACSACLPPHRHFLF